MGFPPISTSGLGLNSVSSLNRVPRPPHKITAFTISRIIKSFKDYELTIKTKVLYLLPQENTIQ
jgi:hypothetical protein